MMMRHLIVAAMSTTRRGERRPAKHTAATALYLLAVFASVCAASGANAFNAFSAASAPVMSTGRASSDIGSVSSFVYHGQAAEIERHPYYVSLQRDDSPGGSHFCGGVLIASDTVLTAAHCLNAEPLPIVHVGRYCSGDCPESANQMNGNYIVAKGVSSQTPTNWDENKFYRGGDLALLKLDRQISGVEPVKLYNPASDAPLSPGERLHVIGLGMDHTGGLADIQQTGALPYMPNADCQAQFNAANLPGLPSDFAIERDMICAGGDDTSACTGDSGGPLVRRGDQPGQDILFGVVTFGVLCGSGDLDMPTVFMSVEEHSQSFLAPYVHTTYALPQPSGQGVDQALDAACTQYGTPAKMTFSLLEEAPCKAVCDRMPLCDAYEFDQYKQQCVIMIMCQQVKHAIRAVTDLRRPSIQEPAKGPDFWPLLPPEVNGDVFRVADGWDCTGSHMQSTSGLDPNSCRQACSSFHSCAAYTFNAVTGECLFKQSCEGWRADSDSYSGNKVHRGQAGEYVMHERTGCVGKSLKGYLVRSVHDCQAECSREEKCAAFSFNSRTNGCFLKASCPRRIKRDNISGVKKNFNKFPSILENIGCKDPTIKAVRVSKFDDCEEECRETQGCTVYTYDQNKKRCYLKGTCFLQKEDDTDTTGFLVITT